MKYEKLSTSSTYSFLFSQLQLRNPVQYIILSASSGKLSIISSDSGSVSVQVLLDFIRAFNKIDDHILLDHLGSYAGPTAHYWFR